MQELGLTFYGYGSGGQPIFLQGSLWKVWCSLWKEKLEKQGSRVLAM